MKGWRTLLINAGIATGAALLKYLGGVNLADYVSPQAAVIGSAAVNIGLRLITTTPVGTK